MNNPVIAWLIKKKDEMRSETDRGKKIAVSGSPKCSGCLDQSPR